jgi:hypothetical protein
MTLLLGACVEGNNASNNSDVPVGIATPVPTPEESNPPPTTGTGVAMLNWLPPTDNTDGSTLTDLAGYNIYYGTSPGSLTNVISNVDIGLSTYVIENLQTDTTYYFSMTAINTNGVESDLSNVISKNILS